jgi:hypothetical protein
LFFDPAIHFALSSAANGAPLLNTAYLPATIEEQIKSRATLVINSKITFFINKDTKVIELSKYLNGTRKILL